MIGGPVPDSRKVYGSPLEVSAHCGRLRHSDFLGGLLLPGSKVLEKPGRRSHRDRGVGSVAHGAAKLCRADFPIPHSIGSFEFALVTIIPGCGASLRCNQNEPSQFGPGVLGESPVAVVSITGC